jgi:MOSC domain-containing protein YiiM
MAPRFSLIKIMILIILCQRFLLVRSASSSGEKKDLIENLRIGKKLTIGEDIVLRVTGPCTRCVMMTLPQGDLPSDLGILKTAAKYNRVTAGVYASVHRGGTIHRGDQVILEEYT